MSGINFYTGIGVMSGTSLDGLDMAVCRFERKNDNWDFRIRQAATVKYDKKWLHLLGNASVQDASGLAGLNNMYGNFIGRELNKFIKKYALKPDYIASHGHTVFHVPGQGYTVQIGNGAEIAAVTGVQTVSDFRATDVALGGQGAPLVPFGDRHLFSGYCFCLNLGGFSNISFEKDGKRLAYDICPVNIIINHLVKPLGLDFDKNGQIASKGTVHKKMLEQLDKLGYYKKPFPKSLGREWLEGCFIPVVSGFRIPVEDKLRTVYEHIAGQIAISLNFKKGKKVLVTGGGAYNKFLVELLARKTSHEIIIPGAEIIEFKEALIFAFLGLQRILNHTNCLSSVTGASRDSCCGAVYSGCDFE